MKTLIIAMNSKYIHSSLAPWYIKACCSDSCGKVKVIEFTINDNMDSLLAALYREKPDIAAFSCYIWNIGHVLRLAENLKKVQPNIVIVLGGPEVSFDSKELMENNGYIDYIISGEGEQATVKLLEYLNGSGKKLDEIPSLTYRNGSAITINEQAALINELDIIPSPYTDEMIYALKDKIVYFESSRGCPFSCSYCLSSTFKGIRYFSLDRVKKDIKRLANSEIRQIKFVDRTFNCNRERAKEIFRFIIDMESTANKNGRLINFHFEAAADLFDEEMLQILSGAPPGLIQFEIGIQTVNVMTLKAINRKTDIEKVFKNILKLIQPGNINIHLDLIAGLPHEDFNSFGISFNSVYNLKPHQLQLGFLKLLKGSSIRRDAKKYGYVFREYPPYEVLHNNSISFDEMLIIKGIEELVERYYNSGRFVRSLDYLAKKCSDSPFQFFLNFYGYNLENGYLNKPSAAKDLYSVIFNYAANSDRTLTGFNGNCNTEDFKQLLKLDFLVSDNSGCLPSILSNTPDNGFREKCFEFLKDRSNLKRYLPEFVDMPAKQIFKKVHFELFNFSTTKTQIILLFNYNNKSPVTGLYNYQVIDL